MKSSKQAALLGCSLSVAALASVRGHHGQVMEKQDCSGNGDGEPQFVVVMLIMGHHCQVNKLTKLGRCDTTAELQTAELLKLLILLEE